MRHMSYREEPGILCSLFQHLNVSKNYYVFNLQDVLWDNVKCHVLQHHLRNAVVSKMKRTVQWTENNIWVSMWTQMMHGIYATRVYTGPSVWL